jgi:hypothetical protein
MGTGHSPGLACLPSRSLLLLARSQGGPPHLLRQALGQRLRLVRVQPVHVVHEDHLCNSEGRAGTA